MHTHRQHLARALDTAHATHNVLMHSTPASSKCEQSWVESMGQKASDASSPWQPTSSSQMGPVPCPKAANERATAPILLYSEEI